MNNRRDGFTLIELLVLIAIIAVLIALLHLLLPTDFAGAQAAFPIGYQRVKDGEIVLLYVAPIDDAASGKVLAYEKRMPESGLYVHMKYCHTIREMTAGEFTAAPRATGGREVPPKEDRGAGRFTPGSRVASTTFD
jgi:prepilin-type N-terminal cleavage/methylation domain-containing protein